MKKKNKKTTIQSTLDNDVWNPWEPDKYPVFWAIDSVEPKYFAVEKPNTPPTKGAVPGNVGEVDFAQYGKWINPYNPANLPEVTLIGINIDI